MSNADDASWHAVCEPACGLPYAGQACLSAVCCMRDVLGVVPFPDAMKGDQVNVRGNPKAQPDGVKTV